MSLTDTVPAAETENAEPAASIADILDARHTPQGDHTAHREVGEERTEPAPATPAAPAASAQPAPPAATPPAQAAPAAGDPDPATDPKAPKWYREHMAKTNRELAAQRAENERLRANPAPAPQQRPAAPAATLPNPAEDPQGYHEAITANWNRQMQDFALRQNLSFSERFMRQQHGAEAFEETRAWLTTRPDIEAWALQQPDPWAAAYTHYSRERLAEEIGDDPNAWRENERARLREELRAEMAAEAPQGQAIRPPPQMRSAPPAPASTARAAAPRDPQTGQFTGPAPLKTRNTF